MAYRVVCISSHDGAGAADTADQVAQALKFRLIDEDIVTRAAVEAGVDKEVVADVERRKSLLLRVLEGLATGAAAAAPVPPAPDGTFGPSASDELRGLIRSVIEDTATAGDVVIVAHAASMALGARGDVLRVLITASERTRELRFAAERGLDEKEGARALKRSDAGRGDYIKRFYGIGEEQPTHYDLVINTDKLTPDDAARLILDAAGGGS